MKAIFCDFYGTVAYENGPISFEVIKRVFKSSDAKSPEAVIEYWWETFRKRIDTACGDNWQPQDTLALENFKELLAHFHSDENPLELCDMMNRHWSNPPIYDDAKPFMENSPLPIYFVTNSDNKFILDAIENHNLKPAGCITSEQAKYSKPRVEIFKYALEKTGLLPNEVIHIGDSISSDIKCPATLGIKAVWLNRDGAPVPDGITAVINLDEALNIIKRQ